MNINEKAAYIRGLMEGLDLDYEKKEVKIINALVDLVEEMATEVDELGEMHEELCERVDEVDQDLAAVEDILYGDEEDLDNECECDDEDEYEYMTECPTCGEKICLNEEHLKSEDFECPGCGEILELDFDDCCEGDCDCGCQEGKDCDCKE